MAETICEHGYQYPENCPDCNPAKKPTAWPTVIIAVIVLGLFLAARSGVFQTAPETANAPRILPTSALISFVPTATLWPSVTPSQTTTPTDMVSPTLTPAPSNTPLPTVAPVATRDLSALETEQAILQHARDVQLEQDITAQEIAWGWVKLAGVSLLMLLAVVAIATAYVRTLRGDFRKAATMPANAPRKAQDASDSDDGTIETPEVWLDMIDWKTGKMPYATQAVEKMFGGQNEYREFVTNMKLAGWAERRPTGWYVTEEFAAQVGREILNINKLNKSNLSPTE